MNTKEPVSYSFFTVDTKYSFERPVPLPATIFTHNLFYLIWPNEKKKKSYRQALFSFSVAFSDFPFFNLLPSTSPSAFILHSFIPAKKKFAIVSSASFYDHIY